MKETFKNLRNVYKNYGKDSKSALIKIFIYSIFGIFTNIALPLISAKFIVNFTDSKFKQAFYILTVLLIIYFIENIKIFLIRKNNQIFKRNTSKNIQLALGKEILKLEQSELDHNSSGVFIQRMSGDTEKMSVIFTGGVVTAVRFLSALGSFIAILIVNYHMFFYYVIASSILTIINYKKNQAVGKKDKIYRKQHDKVSGLVGELVRGARDIKMLYAKKSFLKNLNNEIDIQTEKNHEMRTVDINYNLVISFSKTILEYLAVIFIIFLINKNIITVAVGLVLFNYRTTVLASFMDIVSELLETCRDFNISCERVFLVLSNKEFKKETFGENKIKRIKGNLEFKDVSFSYNGEKNVINHLSLKIDANKTYGIVGKSGEGKTTLFNLLCKLYNYNSGEITIDGKNINDLDEESIRGNITIISQTPYIFNMSIKDNLRLVKSDVTEEEIQKACKLACLDEFIDNLPNKYDTIVGEGGVNLSGGQRQRLAIARALIQKTKIILFDEATSALDNETQNNIQTAINNLKEDYTIIIIAHRLSTIINCEKIFFMRDGKIESEGTHEELLKHNKNYKELYEYEIKRSEYNE